MPAMSALITVSREWTMGSGLGGGVRVSQATRQGKANECLKTRVMVIGPGQKEEFSGGHEVIGKSSRKAT